MPDSFEYSGSLEENDGNIEPKQVKRQHVTENITGSRKATSNLYGDAIKLFEQGFKESSLKLKP